MSLSLFAASVAFVASVAVPCLVSAPAIEIETSNAAVDLQAMFDDKAKEAGCEGQTLSWLLPRSPVRDSSEADPYSDFRFFQIVPFEGDLYFYYYSKVSGESDSFSLAALSFVNDVSDDGTYHDSFSDYSIGTEPADFGFFRKSVLRNAYSFVVGSRHRVAVSFLGYYSHYLPVLRGCSGFEICWEDVADGQDPIARAFSDDYVVIKRKLAVLDCVLVPSSHDQPQSAFENFWCFFDLGDSSSLITDLGGLVSARVSYFMSSYVASEHRGRSYYVTSPVNDHGQVYGGLYNNDKDYLAYLGDTRVTEAPFPHHKASDVTGITYESYSVDPKPTVYDVVSSGVSVLASPDEGTGLHQWFFGHDDLVYAYDSIQKLDDVSLAALSLQESFLETEGARVKSFVELCKEYRDYSDSGVSGRYDYAILLNDRILKRNVVAEGPCWEGFYTNSSCHQIDSVRLLTLTFHNDLLGGDITFSCVDTPVDTTVAHITQPYTIHVNGIVDYFASAWDNVLSALKIALGVVGFAGACYLLYLGFKFAFGLSSLRNGRRIKALEAKSRNSRKKRH